MLNFELLYSYISMEKTCTEVKKMEKSLKLFQNITQNWSSIDAIDQSVSLSTLQEITSMIPELIDITQGSLAKMDEIAYQISMAKSVGYKKKIY